MAYLLDTGILLRLVDTKDRQHPIVIAAVRVLGNRAQDLFIAVQNIAEFCNVATRSAASNGLSLPPADAVALLDRDIAPICNVLDEGDLVAEELKKLVRQYNVIGKQVHDARLVATMLTWGVENILTLNERNFRRFEPEGIKVVTPAVLITPAS